MALGVVCTFGTLHFDTYTECASASHQFYAGDGGEFDFPFEFFICSESASFSLGTSTTPQIIPNVTIRTDNYWLLLPERRCLTTTTATRSPVSSAPVSVPPTGQPSLSPIQALTSSPIIVPTMISTIDDAPIIPRMNPTTSTSISTSTPINRSMNNDDNGASSGTLIGIVVGCVGAGFLLTALIAYMMFVRKRNAHVTTTKTFLSNADTSPTENRDITDFSSHAQSPQTGANPVVPLAQTALASTPPDARGLTLPNQYVPELKDQCRDVAMVPNYKSSRKQPSRITDVMANDTVPMVNASKVRLISEVSSNSKEPPGRQFSDM